MSDKHQPLEPTSSRNRALARDLEDLPLDLIEQVIKEVTFERIIRLTSWAGPQLRQALAISPSWRHLSGAEDYRRSWQRCLLITDRINTLCFNTKHEARPFFERRVSVNCRHREFASCDCSRDVYFLQNGPWPKHQDAPTLRRRWLATLNTQLSTALSSANLLLLEDLETHSRAEGSTLFGQSSTLAKHFSEIELENGTRLCQETLAGRRTAMANELRRLANLYETYPRLLKVPFAPQSSKPSVRHVPEQFRRRARKLEEAPLTLHNRMHSRTYFQDAFPALVPYDWTLRFFVTALKKGQISSDKCQFVLDGIACYYLRNVEKGSQDHTIRTTGTPCSLSQCREKRTEFLAGKNGPTHGREGPYAAHIEIELTWLETFVKVVASLVEEFPQAAEAVQVEEIV